MLVEHASRFPAEVRAHIETLAGISKRLRKERELAFYGDLDFIPTKEYSEEDAQQARTDAELVLGVALRVIM